MKNTKMPLILILTGLAIVLFTATSCTTKQGVYRDTAKSVVMVTSPDEPGGGTGFIVRAAVNGKKGVKAVLTNAHVCGVVQTGPLMVSNDTSIEMSPIIRVNKEHDLCLLYSVPGPALSVSSNDLGEFEELYVVGHPRLSPKTPTEGVYIGEEIAVLPDTVDAVTGVCPSGTKELDTLFGTICLRKMQLAKATFPIFPGNSGSPVVNAAGELVGIVNSANRDNQGGFIPLRYVKEFLDNE